MTQEEVKKEVAEWSPEKRAEARQWLIEKRLDSIRAKVPPHVFEGLAESIDCLLAGWDAAVEK